MINTWWWVSISNCDQVFLRCRLQNWPTFISAGRGGWTASETRYTTWIRHHWRSLVLHTRRGNQRQSTLADPANRQTHDFRLISFWRPPSLLQSRVGRCCPNTSSTSRVASGCITPMWRWTTSNPWTRSPTRTDLFSRTKSHGAPRQHFPCKTQSWRQKIFSGVAIYQAFFNIFEKTQARKNSTVQKTQGFFRPKLNEPVVIVAKWISKLIPFSAFLL